MTGVAVSLGIGLLLGALCIATGYLVIGMGHGWSLPARYGWLSLLFYPLALVRWRWLDRATPWRRDLGITILFAAPILMLSAYLDVSPPPPQNEALKWLILATVPAAYWLTGRALERRRRQVAFADAVLLAVGIVLDLAAWIAFNGSTDGAGTARAYPGLTAPWLVLWLGWQAIAAMALYRHLRLPARAI